MLDHVDQITKQNEHLIHELAVQERQSKSTSNQTAVGHIQYLQDQGDKYAHKIELEKQRLSELQKQIDIVQEKLLLQKRKVGGTHASQENNHSVAKQIRTLEGRLDKALVRFNSALGKNKHYRSKIDEFRKERVVFDGIYRKLEIELHEQNKVIAAQINECNEAYIQRDSLKSDLANLEQQAKDEEEQFAKQCQELKQQLQDTIMDPAVAKPNPPYRHAPAKTNDGAGQRDQDHDAEAKHRGNLTLSEERSIKKKIAKGAWALGKDKAHVSITHEKINSYEEAFSKIQEVTGIDDLEDLVDRFLEAEDKNFSLFQYMNELNAEIEKVDIQLQEVRTEMDKYRGEGSTVNNQRKRILRDLEAQYEKTEQRAELYENRYHDSVKTLNQLKSGIGGLFSKIGCDSNSVEEVLGHDGVTEANMMQYLGVVEQRANEILQLFAASQQKSSSVLGHILGVSSSATASSPQSDSISESFDVLGTGTKRNNVHRPLDLPRLQDHDTHSELDVERPLFLKELQDEALRMQQAAKGFSKKYSSHSLHHDAVQQARKR